NPLQAPSAPNASPSATRTSSGSGLQLNLSSGAANLLSPASKAVTIELGGSIGSNGSITNGTLFTVLPHQQVTPAIMMAVSQVMANGTQNILLNTAGAATGGSMLLPSVMNNLASLQVP